MIAHPFGHENGQKYPSTSQTDSKRPIHPSFHLLQKPEDLLKVRKNTRRGGWIVFSKTSSLRSEELFSGSESEVVQNLSEFRVSVQRIKEKNRGRKNTSNYTGSFHKPEVVLFPLHFQWEFHQNVMSNYKLLNHTRNRLLNTQGQLQETSMLNHTWKRLLCSRTTPRDFLCSITTERDLS